MKNNKSKSKFTEVIDLNVKISKCYLNSKHRETGRHPAYVGSSFFRYTKTKATTHLRDTKIWIREDSKNLIRHYLICNRTKRGYRKKIIEI